MSPDGSELARHFTHFVWDLYSHSWFRFLAYNSLYPLLTLLIVGYALLRTLSMERYIYARGLAIDCAAIYVGYLLMLLLVSVIWEALGRPAGLLDKGFDILLDYRIVLFPLFLLMRDYVTFNWHYHVKIRLYTGSYSRLTYSQAKTALRVALRNLIPAVASTLLFLEDQLVRTKIPGGFWNICLFLFGCICLIDIVSGLSFKLSGLWPVLERVPDTKSIISELPEPAEKGNS